MSDILAFLPSPGHVVAYAPFLFAIMGGMAKKAVRACCWQWNDWRLGAPFLFGALSLFLVSVLGVNRASLIDEEFVGVVILIMLSLLGMIGLEQSFESRTCSHAVTNTDSHKRAKKKTDSKQLNANVYHRSRGEDSAKRSDGHTDRANESASVPDKSKMIGRRRIIFVVSNSLGCFVLYLVIFLVKRP